MVTVAPRNFVDKKSRILSALAVPDTQYNDLSPKGTVDAPIRALIDQINQRPGCVTTSSCSGRIAVYLEGGAQGDAGGQTDGDDATEVTSLSSGMKGGGRWLYVSHDPVELGEYSDEELCAMLGLVRVSKEKHDVHSARTRWIHLKFEPFVRIAMSIDNDIPIYHQTDLVSDPSPAHCFSSRSTGSPDVGRAGWISRERSARTDERAQWRSRCHAHGCCTIDGDRSGDLDRLL